METKLTNDIVSTIAEDKPLIYISEEAINLKRDNDELKQKIDKAIEEIDDILYYWCELCEVEWVELRIEDFTNIFKKLKSILEGMEGEDK